MNNQKLEALLDQMKAAKTNENSQEFVELLKGSQVLVPAVLPKETDPEAMRKMLANQGKNLPLPDGVNPQPCVLENGNKQKFLPVFTSESQMKQDDQTPKFPLTLNLPFQTCIDLLKSNPEVIGTAVNPFTHNVVFRVNENNQNTDTPKNLTQEQFHALTRQKMEAYYLPKNLFEKKEALVNAICTREGEELKELYDQLYDTEIACPYTPQDFEILKLNIREDLLLVQVTMPVKHRVPQTCSSVVFGWNSQKDKIWYYAIVTGDPSQPSQLIQMDEAGQPANLGQAPQEGSELTTILELIDKENA